MASVFGLFNPTSIRFLAMASLYVARPVSSRFRAGLPGDSVCFTSLPPALSCLLRPRCLLPWLSLVDTAHSRLLTMWSKGTLKCANQYAKDASRLSLSHPPGGNYTQPGRIPSWLLIFLFPFPPPPPLSSLLLVSPVLILPEGNVVLYLPSRLIIECIFFG